MEEDGASRLLLVVHPDVGPLDPVALLDHFLLGLAEGSSAQRVMALQWRQSGFLAVERRPPLRTATGRVLHVHRAAAP